MPGVVLDTNIVIGILDPDDSLHGCSTRAFREQEDAGSFFSLSAVTWAELMVGALRKGPAAVDALRVFADRAIEDVVMIDTPLAERAAEFRARDLGLRLADALVLATGVQTGAAVVLTGDEKIKKVEPDLVQLVRR